MLLDNQLIKREEPRNNRLPLQHLELLLPLGDELLHARGVLLVGVLAEGVARATARVLAEVVRREGAAVAEELAVLVCPLAPMPRPKDARCCWSAV